MVLLTKLFTIAMEISYFEVCEQRLCPSVCTRWKIWWLIFSWNCLSAVFQRNNGNILTTASVKHLSHRRFVVSFQLDDVQRTDQDLYRCVTQSPRGSGVSNYAELVVKGKWPLCSVVFIQTLALPLTLGTHNIWLWDIWSYICVSLKTMWNK